MVTYPNPIHGKFKIANLVKSEKYQIFNSNGQLIQSGLASKNEEIFINNLGSQNYFIKIGDQYPIQVNFID